MIETRRKQQSFFSTYPFKVESESEIFIETTSPRLGLHVSIFSLVHYLDNCFAQFKELCRETPCSCSSEGGVDQY